MVRPNLDQSSVSIQPLHAAVEVVRAGWVVWTVWVRIAPWVVRTVWVRQTPWVARVHHAPALWMPRSPARVHHAPPLWAPRSPPRGSAEEQQCDEYRRGDRANPDKRWVGARKPSQDLRSNPVEDFVQGAHATTLWIQSTVDHRRNYSKSG